MNWDLYLALFKYFVKGIFFFFGDLKKGEKFQKLIIFIPTTLCKSDIDSKNHYKWWYSIIFLVRTNLMAWISRASFSLLVLLVSVHFNLVWWWRMQLKFESTTRKPVTLWKRPWKNLLPFNGIVSGLVKCVAFLGIICYEAHFILYNTWWVILKMGDCDQKK